ncbi:MAG: carboxypeptidase regulatory-like domain-containing protein [Candidatus Desantisbacteria bacterium]
MIGIPNPPNLSLPLDGATVNTLRTEFDWEDVPGAVECGVDYEVEISTDSTFPEWNSTTAICYSSNFSTWLNDNTTYYWRVRAKNYAGKGNWSTTRWFKVAIFGSISGNVTTECEGDQDGATITAVSIVTGGIGPPFIKSVITNEKGDYTIGDLPPGTYKVSAFQWWYDDVVHDTVSVYAGYETFGIDFTLTILRACASIRLSAPSSTTIRNAPEYSRFAQAMRAKGLRSPAVGTATRVLESIEKVSPVLRTGLVDIIVETAIPLIDAPVLNYVPVAGGTPEKVVLSGDGSVWRGQIFVESTTPEGTATFHYYAVDKSGSVSTQIKYGKEFIIDTTIYPEEGGEVSNQDGSLARLPAGALMCPVNIRIVNAQPNLDGPTNLEVSGVTFNCLPRTKRQFSTQVDGKEGENVANSLKKFTICLPYPDLDDDGLVDNIAVPEEKLRMVYEDSAGRWRIADEYTIDTAANKVKAEVTAFTKYMLASIVDIATVDKIISYPNPWHTDKSGLIKITYIPFNSQPSIYIYNIAGELVRTLHEDREIVATDRGYMEADWDGKNDNGETVASGIYIYLVKCNKGTKTGKMVIIR